MNKENLAKLKDKLLTVSSEEFDMGQFRRGREKKEEMNNPPCGTVACALGWAPTIPGLEMSDNEAKNSGWHSYCERVFGIEAHGHSPEQWDFLFDGNWADFDNTPLGAAKRIQYLLNGGEDNIPYNIECLLDGSDGEGDYDDDPNYIKEDDMDRLYDLIREYKKIKL